MNHVRNNDIKTAKGFTIVELMLAMTFVSMLLLAIALTIVQIANIYNRGMVLKEVNQISRSLDDELGRAVRSSSSFSTDPAAKRYVHNEWGGRLCTGQYSYIWNYGKALSQVSTNRNQYSGLNESGNIVKEAGKSDRSEITFVKAPDTGSTYCVANESGKYPNIAPANAVELIRTGDHSLAVHSFNIVPAPSSAQDTLSSQQLYSISYTIGTSNIEALTETGGLWSCKAPNVIGADFNYCTIQNFTIVLRAVSGVN